MERLEPALKSISSTKSPEMNMRILLSCLDSPVIVPQPNKYYVFGYLAKTPGITFDQHPLILSGNVYRWGFNGNNIHWNEIRQYTWNELYTPLYEITDEEIETVSKLPIAKFRTR